VPRAVPDPDARFRQTARTWGRHAMPVIPDGAFVIYHATFRRRPDLKQFFRNGVPLLFVMATGTEHIPPCRSVCKTQASCRSWPARRADRHRAPRRHRQGYRHPAPHGPQVGPPRRGRPHRPGRPSCRRECPGRITAPGRGWTDCSERAAARPLLPATGAPDAHLAPPCAARGTFVFRS